MSSTIPAVSGRSSETSVPHCPCLANFHGSAEQLLARAVDEAEHDVAVVLGAVSFRQFGLRVEQVDMRRTAVHEQRDHRLRLGSEVRRRALRSSGRFSPGFFTTSASAPSWRSKWARAIAPTPKAVPARNSRRLAKGRFNRHRGTRWRSGVAGRDSSRRRARDQDQALASCREPYSLTHAASSGVIGRW